MTQNRHGGDIYAEDLNGKILDFSASINPLGMPEDVRSAAKRAIMDCIHYPDPYCRKLRAAIAQREGTASKYIFCGNGAADVLYRLLLALKPKKLLLPVPTFGEYEHAAILTGCETVYFPLQEEKNFDLDIDFWNAVSSDIDAAVLCSPNNPTGRIIPKRLVQKGLETGIHIIMDECFQDFVDEPERMEWTKYNNLVVLRSLTKMYAVPGIRLGYCISSNTKLLERLYLMGAPWAVSVIAQECGIAAAKDIDFPERTRRYISVQRNKLAYGLRKLGFHVIPSSANFILFKNEIVPDLVSKLRTQGILLRSCENFQGLDARWIRIAVRTETENLILLRALEEQIKERQDVKWKYEK